MRAVKG